MLIGSIGYFNAFSPRLLFVWKLVLWSWFIIGYSSSLGDHKPRNWNLGDTHPPKQKTSSSAARVPLGSGPAPSCLGHSSKEGEVLPWRLGPSTLGDFNNQQLLTLEKAGWQPSSEWAIFSGLQPDLNIVSLNFLLFIYFWISTFLELSFIGAKVGKTTELLFLSVENVFSKPINSHHRI